MDIREARALIEQVIVAVNTSRSDGQLIVELCAPLRAHAVAMQRCSKCAEHTGTLNEMLRLISTIERTAQTVAVTERQRARDALEADGEEED